MSHQNTGDSKSFSGNGNPLTSKETGSNSLLDKQQKTGEGDVDAVHVEVQDVDSLG